MIYNFVVHYIFGWNHLEPRNYVFEFHNFLYFLNDLGDWTTETDQKGEWDPIKIVRKNLDYIPNTTQHTS